MSEDYISQFYTWSTGNTITAARLNGNVSNVTDGLSGGSKAANLGKLLVGGTEVINSSRAIIATGVTLSGDITSTGTAVDWDLQDNVASALSFDASGKTGLLEFVTTNSGEGLNTSGFLKIVSDAASLTAVGAFVLGAGGDAGLFFNGTDLTIQTDGAGASGIIFDSEDDTFEFKGSGTLQATFDTTGLNLVSGDVFKINGTSVLSNDTLGSNVVNTSITSTGALNSGSITSGFGNIDVGSSNIDGGTITADTGFTGNLSGTATNATHVTVTDNESTDEDNLITFVEDATSSTGNVGLEMDGNLTYNPSTGRLTATQLSGTLQTAAQTNITSVGTLSNLTVSGVISIADGSEGSPSLTHTSDTNTGVFFPADDVVGISTSGTERFRVNSVGNVGIGVQTISNITNRSQLAIGGSTGGLIDLHVGSDVEGRLFVSNTEFILRASQSDGQIIFQTGGSNERLKIDSSGDINIGNASTSSNGMILYNSGQIYSYANGTGASHQVRFYRNVDSSGALVGSISTDGSNTAYNTSSDYRLKENVKPITDGISRLMKLKPSRFNFLIDKDETVDGFIAHEVQDIIPNAVTGKKDAVDEEGKPEYQGIDHSKIVPLLVASVQELKSEIDTLKGGKS